MRLNNIEISDGKWVFEERSKCQLSLDQRTVEQRNRETEQRKMTAWIASWSFSRMSSKRVSWLVRTWYGF